MLKEDKLYYLAHPLTTGGRNIEQNRIEEKLVYYEIMSRYPKAKILRPLALLPDNMDDEQAMKKCYNLLAAADIVIMSPGWETSTGCMLELKFSENNLKDILLYKNHEMKLLENGYEWATA